MAEELNSECSICGNRYHACLSCKDVIQLSPWKIHTDTAEHYKVFQIVRGYSTKVYDKNEARQRLSKVDLSDRDGFRDNIKAIIDEIMGGESEKHDAAHEAGSRSVSGDKNRDYRKKKGYEAPKANVNAFVAREQKNEDAVEDGASE